MAASIALSTLVVLMPVPALADPAGASGPDVAGTDADLQPGDSLTYNRAEVEQIRNSDAADEQLTDRQIDEARDDYVQETEDSGIYVDPATVDVIPLLDGKSTITVDDDQVVDSVTFTMSDNGQLKAAAQTSERDPQEASFSGPGMAINWRSNGGGSYNIKIYVDFSLDGRGELLYASGHFTWQRWTADADGVTYYRYQRFGDFQPESISGVQDARAQRLRIQSFPFDSVEKNLLDVWRYSPASDRSDDCSSYSASLTFKGVGVSVPFNERCGVYNMWRNIDKPSSYWIQYENSSGGTGNREVAYVLVWSQKKGTAGSMHDLNLIDTLIVECQQTDAARTCHW